jgi:hypothetical protein
MDSALTQACTLRLEKFEGPFDLLFHLIEKNQIDQYDIPILTITDSVHGLSSGHAGTGFRRWPASFS